MTNQREARWEYDAVQVGQAGTPVTVDITDDNISAYAASVRNHDPAYHKPPAVGDTKVGMPAMIFRVAPLRRGDIAANNGFVALEYARDKPRQTPFAKCEVRWSRPVRVGDSVTSSGRIVDKYERRGSRFVTFRVEATNQRSEQVAEYDYTCIFEYAKAQKR